MRAVRQPDRCTRTADLLHRNDMLEIAQATAAIFKLHRDAEEPKRAQLRPQVARKEVRGIDFSGAWRDELGGKLAHGLAQQINAFAQSEIEFDQGFELLCAGCRKLSDSSSSVRGARQA